MKNRLFHALTLAFLYSANSQLSIAHAQPTFGNAVSLDGTSQCVSVPAAAASALKSPLTIEAWVYERNYASSSRLMDFGNQAGNSEIAFELTSGTSGQPRVQFFVGAGFLVGDLISPSVVPLNTWTHLAFTYDGTNGSLYINGSLATNGPMIFPSAPVTRTNNFIGRSSGGDPYANAIIDEFRIWTVARTPDQIRGSFYKRLLGTEAGLLLYYKFDSASGSVAYNYAEAGGAAYDGALVNGPAWVTRPSYKVTTATDGGAGSLRDAINTLPDGGYIYFATNLAGQSTFLTQGQLVVNNSLIIDASAVAGGVTLYGPLFGPAFRIFYIPNNASTVILDSLDLEGGHAPDGSSGVPGQNGGAIYNSGTLLLNSCTLFGNHSGEGGLAAFGSTLGPASPGGDGGAIYNLGMLMLTGCVLSENFTGRGGSGEPFPVNTGVNPSGYPGTDAGDGGAIYNGGSATLNGCTLTYNYTQSGGDGSNGIPGLFINGEPGSDAGNGGNGGAIFSLGPLTLTSCTLNTNFTTSGGIGGGGADGNHGGKGGNSGSGGAILCRGPLALTSCTLMGNLAGNMGTIEGLGMGGGAGGVGNVSTSTFRPPLDGDSGNSGNGGDGGAIFSLGLLAMTNCTLSFNASGEGADGGPGAIGSDGEYSTLPIVGDPTGGLIGNGGNGGNAGNGGNGGNGGAIFVSDLNGPSTLIGCTFFGNRTGLGGAGGAGGRGGPGATGGTSPALPPLHVIRGDGGNGGNGGNGGYGGQGGAISTSAALTIISCTLSGNVAINNAGGGSGGAAGGTFDPIEFIDGYPGTNGLNAFNDIGGGGIANSGNLVLWNTLVGGNYAFGFTAQDFYGPIDSQGHNLIGYNGGNFFVHVAVGDLVGTDAAPLTPLLAPLGNYGGPTPTMPLLAGSPGIDAGDDSILNFENTDERGAPRLAGSHVEIGAVEGVFNPAGPGKLTSPVRLPGGSFSFSFTNQPGATFSVYASDSPGAPMNLWTYLGPAVPTPPGSGHFTFIDSQAANLGKRFYRVGSP